MSGVPLLTIDIGNTRCKACFFLEGGGEPRALFDVELADAAGAVSEALPRDVAEDCRGAISCVAADDVVQTLRESLERTLGSPVPVNPDCGLELDVEHAETVGRDRLFAARGAFELDASPAVVVDAGTALTVDALAIGADGRGRFLGGAIAPGPDMMASALARGGARLWNVAVRPRVPALGKHTAAALEAGAGVGFEGAALHLVRCVAREAGLQRPRVVLTGGRRDFLEHLRFLDRSSGRDQPESGEPHGSLTTVPHLVHIGLAAAVRA